MNSLYGRFFAFKGALSHDNFAIIILVKTAQIFDKESVF